MLTSKVFLFKIYGNHQSDQMWLSDIGPYLGVMNRTISPICVSGVGLYSDISYKVQTIRFRYGFQM